MPTLNPDTFRKRPGKGYDLAMDTEYALSLRKRSLAAAVHFSYILFGLAVGLSIVHPTAGIPVMAFLGLGLLLIYRFGRTSPFLRRHTRQALRYHRFGLALAATFAIGAVLAGIFSWGLALPFAAAAVPLLLCVWALPTLKAARRALAGREYSYNQLKPAAVAWRSGA